MRYRVAALAVFLLFAWLAFARTSSTANSAGVETQQRRRPSTTVRRPSRSTSGPPARADYSKFSHASKAHQQQECSACHKFPSKNWKEARKGDAAFADITEYPEHSSCLKCHYQQFFARERPAPRICSVCHVGVTPRFTDRQPFPNPPELFNASKLAPAFISDFRIAFPHETHLELVGELRAPGRVEDGNRFERASFGHARSPQEKEKSCSVCHQTYQPQGKSNEEYVTPRPKNLPDESFWLKKGSFKTTPNHATCFTCHTPEADIKPASSDCATCHKLAPAGALSHVDFDPRLATTMGITDGFIWTKWRRRDSAGAFTHEGGAHADLACATCHKVQTMNTLDEKTKKVAVLSCGGEGTGCHIEADASGILNIEVEQKKAKADFQCTKCHITFGKEPIPKSHLDATAAARAK
ncbi:MAG TPA: cytochrome c3 family protein [Pyrinomonadaceae bacterium]|nr:cytochrome c3 family protein [Pyrinomonadaceae bacterium]